MEMESAEVANQTSSDTGVPLGSDINAEPIPLGMSSFDQAARREFGEKLRVAMACIDGAPGKGSCVDDAYVDECEANNSDVSKTVDAADIGQRLRSLARRADTQLCQQIELLVQFDELEGWRETGARHCVAWMSSELSIGRTLASERLRVGRQLRELPVLRALFRSGSLGWCKIRLLTRVADEENERLLARAALDASVCDVERLCEEYRWPKKEQESDKAGGEDARALARFNQRTLTWRKLKSGNTELRLILPPELAQNILKSIEHCEDVLFKMADEAADEAADSNKEALAPTASQRRADAAVMMAERSLAYAGNDILRADRYQVVLTVDADVLAGSAAPESEVQAMQGAEQQQPSPAIPSKHPLIEQAGPVALSTAQRLACDCRIMGVVSAHGEPVSIGRQTRLWPAAMRRAIIARDRHCQFPGCHSSRALAIHHIKSWLHGGATSVENAMCLCQAHHTMVHEGGYRITRRRGRERAFDRHNHTPRNPQQTESSETSLEEALRGDRALGSLAEQLLPSRHRFVVEPPTGKLRENCLHA